jgi:HK97 family phage prohead protease
MADLTPTREMAAEAAKGLRWHAEGLSGEGIVDSTLAWARRIAARDELSPDRVVTMRAWHARHATDLDAPQNSNPSDEGYPGPGRVASALWGGLPAAEWAERKVDELEREAETDARGTTTTEKETQTMERRELSGPGWTPRQAALYDVLEQVAEVFGPFDTGTGPDGIHYIAAADNPFAAEGIRCANCAFFQGGGGCELVADEVRVEPDAACKFWIILADRLAGDEPAPEMTDEMPAEEQVAESTRDLPEGYRLALEDDVPAGRACGNCRFYDETERQGDSVLCQRWAELVRGDHYCDAWQGREDESEDAGYGMKDDEDEDRIVVRRDLVEFAELRDRLAGEARSLDVTVTEARAIPADDGGYVIEGHAAVFDSNSYPLPDGRGSYFIEQVKRGAFRRALQNPEGPTVALINHDPNLILASTGSTPPTLELWEDPKGLRIRAHVAPTSYAEDLRVLMERGDVSGMSFGFTVEADRWWQDGEGRTRRDIQRIGRLTDVSVVVSPAYPEPASGITSREADEPHEEATASESATGGPPAAASASTRRRRLELIERETARNPIRKEP